MQIIILSRVMYVKKYKIHVKKNTYRSKLILPWILKYPILNKMTIWKLSSLFDINYSFNILNLIEKSYNKNTVITFILPK